MGKSAPCSSQGLVLFADTFQFLAFLGRQWQLREEIKPHRISRLRTQRHFDLHIEARPLEQGGEATSDQGIRAGAVKSIQPKPSGNDRLGILEHAPVVGLDQRERSPRPEAPDEPPPTVCSAFTHSSTNWLNTRSKVPRPKGSACAFAQTQLGAMIVREASCIESK